MAEEGKMINYHRLTGISNPDHPGNNVIEYWVLLLTRLLDKNIIYDNSYILYIFEN